MNEDSITLGYEDLSRRGLIRMAKDYDDISDKQLEEFLLVQTASGKPYESTRPVEHFTDKLDKLGKGVGTATAKNLDKIFDHLTNKIPEAIDLIAETLSKDIMMGD